MSTTVAAAASSPASDSNTEHILNRQLTIALVGNPNAGKTSLFNALTGLRQKVANYPGVTVERKEGAWQLAPAQTARLIDLPGLYSLEAASIDEQIARDVITGRIANVPAPDVLVAVVDATNLERNLYLVTQLLDYERPLVLALTMIDLAERRNIKIDAQELSKSLGVPVVPVTASQHLGTDSLAAAVIEAAQTARTTEAAWQLSETTERELAALAETETTPGARYTALRDLYADDLPVDGKRRAIIEGARARLAQNNAQWWQEPLVARYEWIERIAARAVRGNVNESGTTTERIDRIFTHRFFGPAILIAVMLLVFQTIFSWAALPMDLIDGGFGWLGETVRHVLPPGLLTNLMVDGVIAGVGGVLVFLPQILLLFFFIAILEDTGYMARAAFLMDRLMRGVGLHGKAFMPLLSSFACAIPGIMATRTIENPKDRLATIMIAPFMSCSARLPVYTLMIAAFFSNQRLFGFLSIGALLILAMYLLGIVVAIVVAWILKHTILKAPTPPLVLELPPYRVPGFSNILQTMISRGGLFVKRAGTVILAISIILWALVTFPRLDTTSNNAPAATMIAAQAPAAANEAEAESKAAPGMNGQSSEQVNQSFAGRAGHLIEPVIAPLGFDWKMGVALISSFAARETLVSTLSIIYNVGSDAESDSVVNAVRNAKRADGRPAWTPLVALSMMVFFVLALQCMSTVAIVRRETNSWRWPLFMIGYMTALAYLASFITYQGGRLLGFS
ncbi:MAG: ferrous iron transport protein B [Pyrinomonadaceae bacterium]